MKNKKTIADQLKDGSKLQLKGLMVAGIEAYEIKDYKTSYDCFTKAVELGDENAAWLLGRQYYYGEGCNQSYLKAAKYYKMAATKGVKESMYELACCYHYGLGVRRSEKAAIKYLTLSADEGYSLAQEFLAKIFLAHDEVDKACIYFGLSAEQGRAESQYYMFLMFKMGYVSQDLAVKYLQLSAENGHAKAQRCLGELYFYGDLGLPEDKTLAFFWCERAGQQNDAEGAYCVGLSYLNGDGVEANPQMGEQWLRIAANLDYAEAQLALARALLREKTETAFTEATEWLSRGAALGNTDCKYGLKLLQQMREQGISYLDV